MYFNHITLTINTIQTAFQQLTYQNNKQRFINITMISHELLHIIFCISINNRIFASVLAVLIEGTTVPSFFCL